MSGAFGSPFGAGTRLTIASRISSIADALLGRGEDHLFARDREDVLELLDHHVGLGRRQVDLVEDRDDREALAEREVDVREGLGLDALRGVDDEDRALARLERAADLVREVDVAGRVDQVQPVRQAVLRRVLEPDGARLDRDALLALEVHRIEDLARHLPGIDRVRELEQPVGERRFAVIDVGDDREVAQAFLGDQGSSRWVSRAAVEPISGRLDGGRRHMTTELNDAAPFGRPAQIRSVAGTETEITD